MGEGLPGSLPDPPLITSPAGTVSARCLLDTGQPAHPLVQRGPWPRLETRGKWVLRRVCCSPFRKRSTCRRANCLGTDTCHQPGPAVSPSSSGAVGRAGGDRDTCVLSGRAENPHVSLPVRSILSHVRSLPPPRQTSKKESRPPGKSPPPWVLMHKPMAHSEPPPTHRGPREPGSPAHQRLLACDIQ